MFTPIINIAPIPLSPTLVATTLPDSIALRVPYDNVTPSVSSAKLDNNASNNTALPKTNTPQSPVLEDSVAEKPYLKANNNYISFKANASTAFLAQLAGGNISSETHSLFLKYEKLLSYADVKYKPSNAGKPVEPIGIFGALLQKEKDSTINSLQNNDAPILTPIPISSEPAQISTVEKYAPAPQTQFQLEKEIILTQLQAYSETITRNHKVEATDLESV